MVLRAMHHGSRFGLRVPHETALAYFTDVSANVS